MKKICLLMALLLGMSSAACSDEKGALQTSQKYLESVEDAKEAAENNGLYSITDWLTPETEYIAPADASGREREYITFRYSDRNGSGNRFGYISLKSGELFDICPDPFCDHRAENGCKYTNLSGIITSLTDETKVYSSKIVYENKWGSWVIYFIDTKTGVMTELYRRELDAQTNYSISLMELTEKYLYFTESAYFEVEIGEGKTEDSYKEHFIRLDLATNETEVIAEFDKPFDVHYMDDEFMYFIDQVGKRIYRTDHNYENEETVFEFGGMFENTEEYSIGTLQYDAESNSLWFGISTNYLRGLSIAKPIEEGNIYRLSLDTLEWEQIEMPSDKIMGFNLYGEYIYYEQYDPVSFGAGRIGTCTDETGNTIYRVRRDNTAESEVVFDGHDKFFVSDYFVMGDYIYIEYMKLIKGADMSYFQNTGMTARVNFKENTIKWLELN